MSTYAIGDVQGCYDELRQLLDTLEFYPAHDQLWFVGDLVNRGPSSLEVLRFVRGLGTSAVTILGNHDLHLLVVAAGVRRPHRGDTLDALLKAPDREELLLWLRHQKLMHAGEGHAMVHAGLLPQWTLEQALCLAGEVEAALRSDDYGEFMQHMYGNEPASWSEALTGYDRLRVVVNAMTRLRLCTPAGRMEFSHKTAPVNMPPGYLPWHTVPERASRGTTLIFGHWAAMGLITGAEAICLDSGCVWGRQLTALRLADHALFQCDCPGVADGEPE